MPCPKEMPVPCCGGSKKERKRIKKTAFLQSAKA